MSFRVEHMMWLALMLLIVPMAWAAWRAGATMSRSRYWLSMLLRLGVLACLALLLADASLVRSSEKYAVIAAVDVSGSVVQLGPRGGLSTPLERVRQAVERAGAVRGPDDLLGVMLFDGTVSPLGLPVGPRPAAGEVAGAVPERETVWQGASPDASNLAGAIASAAAMIPPDASGRVVIFSDGVATSGDAMAAARAARSLGVAVDVVPLIYNVGYQVVLESLEVPTSAPAGAVVPVRAIVSATAPVSGTLMVTVGGEPVLLGAGSAGGKRIELPAGRSVVLAEVQLPPGRISRMEARLLIDEPGTSSQASVPESNVRAEAITITPGAGSVLLVRNRVEGRPLPETLLATLRSELGAVQAVLPGELPSDLVGLEQFDLVIFENVPAEAVSAAQQRALADFVTQLGGGFVMVGGPESFGPGGWRGSQIEPILPVLMQLPERLVMPAVAVIIVMDSSGSMGFRVGGSSRSQQDVANEGAALAIRTLDASDLIGVIEFNSNARSVVDLGPNNDPAGAVRRIRAIYPSGGTNMPPGLEMAMEQLSQAKASVKHCIVLTDGVSAGRNRLEGLARQMAEKGIKLSAICVGDDADDETLEAMAKIGGGGFYRVDNPSLLPRVFLKAMRVVRTPQIRESPFVPVIAPDAGAIGAALAQLGEVPTLGGLVITTPRPMGTVRLTAGPDETPARTAALRDVLTGGVQYPLLTPEGEPLLATWQAGLGRVAAFTSDASVWARRWVDWPGYRRLWTQLAQQTLRQNASRIGEVSAQVIGESLTVRYSAIDEQQRPIDRLVVSATVYLPDEQTIEVPLAQSGPGQYSASVPAPGPGASVVLVRPRRVTSSIGGAQLTPLAPRLAGVVVPPGLELRATASDERALQQIAQAGGGRVLTLPAMQTPAQSDSEPGAVLALWDRSEFVPRQSRQSLWPILMLALLILVYADIANRRLAWDRLLPTVTERELAAQLQRAAPGSAAQSSARMASAQSQQRAVRDSPNLRPGLSLGEDAARGIVEAARRQRIGAARFQPNAEGGNAADDSGGQLGAQVEPVESGLMAAKRRAQRRSESQ